MDLNSWLSVEERTLHQKTTELFINYVLCLPMNCKASKNPQQIKKEKEKKEWQQIYLQRSKKWNKLNENNTICLASLFIFSLHDSFYSGLLIQ